MKNPLKKRKKKKMMILHVRIKRNNKENNPSWIKNGNNSQTLPKE